jgi:TolB-like protein
MSWLANLYKELRRRRVFGMTAYYIIGAWVAVQVTSEILPALNIEEHAIRYAWIAVVAGFPLALIFSWKYDVSAQGIHRTAKGAEATPDELKLGRTDYLLLTGLMLVIAYGVTSLTQNVLREQSAIDVAPQTRTIDPGSIAVLPMVNLSPDPEQEYFASGMYDSLINNLCKVSALKVTSRTSASHVDTKLAMPMIGRILGVASLIEGSIMREGNRVRVAIQLIDAASDQHLWAETYERDFTDVMGLQTDVARAVARAVQVNLTAQDERKLARSLDIRPDTFESYLRAMFQFRKETENGYRRGIEILEEALENDPTSALAYAALAQGYGELGHSFYPVRGAYPLAKAAADKAIELDDTLAEAHLSVAMYKLYYEYDWNGAELAFARSLELNPSLSDAWYHLAWQLELFGRHKEAIAAGIKTIELSPLSPFYMAWLGDQYRAAGDYEKAIDMAESVLRLYPEYPVAWFVLGNTYVEQGRFEEAIEAHSHLGDSAFWFWARAYSYARAGQANKAHEILDGIEHKTDNGLPLAIIYASLNEVDEAMYWAEQIREIRIPWYPFLVGWFPQFRGLHDNPKIIAWAEELGVPLQEAPR